ncbi:MAG: DUF3375 family protein [Candidatus Hydrogenedentes bacterium]|nr:DUF3375 family protein [Candidatus Hydrogenedentota bacterium]
MRQRRHFFRAKSRTKRSLLKQNQPACRLLRSDYAPLVASFLHSVFVRQNVRSVSQADIVELLEAQLFEIRKHSEDDAFPRWALEYLNDWSGSDKGWLRKFYPPDSGGYSGSWTH